ncbi:MAG: glycine cleavage system protein GcvH [Planctomycetota bacterium]|nr:glycine cleavage system protein GcvH [Planctomycetota bacterium]
MIPEDLKYTKSHEWIRVEGDIAVVGITHHAQHELGDIVFVELPEVGDEFETEDECATIESVKAASDIYCPVSGKVVEVNENLEDAPETINNSPYEDGWLFKVEMTDSSQLGALMTAEEYNEEISD